MTRREFVAVSAAAPAVANLAAADDDLAKFDRPMRWAQLTLVEDDPGKFDPQFWLDYFKRVHADAACLSAGGCVAYYPTKIPFHHRSAWLGDRDAFGELFAGCRKLGMVVIARTDPHATYDDVYAGAPGLDRGGGRWAEAAALGLAGDVGHLRAGPVQLRVHDRGDEGDHVALPGGRHLHQPLGRLGHVLLRALPAQLPRATAGMDLPRTDDPQDPARRAYILWRQQRLFELWRLWDAEIREINPDACVHPEHRRRRDERPGHEDHRRAGAHAVRRPAGAAGPGAAVGERQERQGIPRHAGPQGRSSASSASASRSRTAGRTRCRAGRRSGCGWPTGSPTACGRGSRSSPGRCTTSAGCPWWRRSTRATGNGSATCATRRRWRAWGWSTRSRPLVLRRGQGGTQRGGAHPGDVPGAGRSAHSVRDGARPAAGRRAPRPFKMLTPAEHRGALGGAVRAAAAIT